jgi:hypothetical protein
MNKKKYYFEPYQLQEFMMLYDSSENSEGKRQMFDVYTLWMFIKKCFPKIDFINAKWSIGFDSIFSPYIFYTGEGSYDPR